MPPCKSYTAVHQFFSVLVFNLQPHPRHEPRGPMPWNETQPYRVPMVRVWKPSDKKFSRYRLLEYYITEKPLLLMVFYVLTSSPTPWHGPRDLMPWNESRPYRVSMAQVSMLSDKWLSRYGLLENFNTRIAIFEGVLDFNLQSHPLAWTQGPDAME